jgi:hypothetical protein
MKKLDVLYANYMFQLVEAINTLHIQKEDLVGIYPPTNKEDKYSAVFYCE